VAGGQIESDQRKRAEKCCHDKQRESYREQENTRPFSPRANQDADTRQEQPAYRNECREVHVTPEEPLAHWTHIVAVWTIVLAIFAGVQIAVMIFHAWHLGSLARAARDAADFAQLSIRKTERAYIQFVSIECKSFIPGEPFQFELVLKNFGRTPATVTTWAHQVDYGVAALGLDETPEYDPVTGFTPRTYATGEEIRLRGVDNTLVTQGEHDDFKKGTHRLWVYWRIDYTDVFDACWARGCCHELTGGGDLLYAHVPNYNYERSCDPV